MSLREPDPWQLGDVRVSGSRARLWMLSESLLSFDWVALPVRIGLLARIAGTTTSNADGCFLTECYVTHGIAIPADAP